VIQALIAELRRRGETISVQDLAQRLVASPCSLEPSLARRVVAAALGWNEAELDETLSADHLRGPELHRLSRVLISEACFAVVDLETTGLSAEESEILEIGAIRVEKLQLGDCFERLVKPAAQIPARITRLTGIDQRMLADASALSCALAEFGAWIEAVPQTVFVAHNASFDFRFIQRGLERCALSPLGPPVLCTRKLGRRLAPEIGRYSLDAISSHFGVSNRARHRALGDARAAARVLLELLHRATSLGLQSLGELVDLQERAPAAKLRQSR
jgi:DNA polymerase-3 subunit alpha (Gram-positive type)